MAGDWIKMRADLLVAPQFDRLCYELQCGAGELLVLLYRAAEWFEVHGRYGQMPAADAASLDFLLRRPGFSARLKGCGWLKESGGMTRLTGFCQPAATRKSLGAKVRAEVLAAGACSVCGSSDDLVIDHVLPVVRGGSSDPHNLQCLCAPCNRAKGRKTMGEFMESRAAA